MKRVIQGKVETLVARKLIEGDVLPGQTLVIDTDLSGGFEVRVREEDAFRLNPENEV